jgi:hypothetical protein
MDSFVDSLFSKQDRELFKTMLNDYYKYSDAAIKFKGSTISDRTIDYGIAAFTT